MDEERIKELVTRSRTGQSPVPPQMASSCLTACVIALAIIAGLATVLTLVLGAKEAVLIPAAFLCFIAIAGIIYFLRIKIAGSYYEVTLKELPESTRPGESFRWGAVVLPKRRMILGASKVTLLCREHAISRGGTSDSHYRKTICEETFELGERRSLNSGGVAELEAEIAIPKMAIPSCSGRNNRIEWRLTLTAPVPGICPDIKQEVSLRVPPEIGDRFQRGIGKDPLIPSEWELQGDAPVGRPSVGGVRAELRMRDTATVQGLPAIPVGETRRMELTVHTDTEFHCRGVQCWVGCRMHGAGTEEKVDLFGEEFIHEGDFLAGHTISKTISVSIPKNGPVSYQGRYVRLDWLVRVRVDIPVWRDKYLELPFLVTPRLIE